ncbi:apolipoprotein A-Ib [Synchiropus splendidus]|uniref:apolipoprotein A-Ib n=1 Tax=Synchiropus splendidus TaxID=270530 RepID=UPI00237E43C2|nr:apolipoprotein A-Ib [Synchiropus splendidus]
MKFVTLALALLLAVAAQAAPADISPLDHARSVVDMGLTNMKESIKRALSQLDNTEFADAGRKMSQQLDDAHTQLKNFQSRVKPNTDQVFATMSDLTASTRATIQADIEKLKKVLRPQEEHLKAVVDRHIEEYRALLDPIIQEHHQRHVAEMEALKAKLEPVMEELKTKVETNVEETKAALMPIIQTVNNAVSARVSQLHEESKPFINEYREEMEKTMERLRNMDPAALEAVKARLAEKAEVVKGALGQFFHELIGSVQAL